jgi:ABC-2 type transport system permease protein
MIDQIRSELSKVRTTRTAAGLVAGLLAVVALATWVVAGRATGADIAPLHVRPFALATATLLPLFALIHGIRSFTDEFRYGAIVPTLLATPDRRRVLAGKLVVGALVGATMAVLALATSLGVGAAVLASHGLPVPWSTGGAALHALRFAAGGALWGALGVGVGAAVRHQIAAIVGSLVWLLVAENLVLDVVHDAGRFLPGIAGTAALGLRIGSVAPPVTEAFAILAAWTLTAAIAGVSLLRARDVV